MDIQSPNTLPKRYRPMKLLPQEFWTRFKETNGAFSCAEAVALYNICLDAPSGKWIELGSHKCKSTQAIAAAMQSGDLLLVEPEFQNKQWEMEAISKLNFNSWNIRLLTSARFSLEVLPAVNNLSLVFVDSGIHDDMVMDEVRLIEDKMVKGGVIAFHDYRNQFTAVERAYNYLLSTGKYVRVEINWDEIFAYAKENNIEEGNVSWHQYPELPHPPNFVGALKRI